ncbi:hypothetical protein RJ639_046212 [Escallonia herrerae]|uniref:Uncharacterized protein n=1 Tax=Escallonia herrerae TaxID=1293975 RepID=A0AA88W681_9ASTE|nr:hypothetical protein RJ639_046212 [Escallonia herrerae]
MQVANPKESLTGEKPKDMPPKKKGNVLGKGLMYVNIKVNGKAIRAMVDTSATHNYISSIEVERLGLTLKKGADGTGSTNSVADALSRRAKLNQVALMAMNAIVRADSQVAINIGKKIRKALTRDPGGKLLNFQTHLLLACATWKHPSLQPSTSQPSHSLPAKNVLGDVKDQPEDKADPKPWYTTDEKSNKMSASARPVLLELLSQLATLFLFHSRVGKSIATITNRRCPDATRKRPSRSIPHLQKELEGQPKSKERPMIYFNAYEIFNWFSPLHLCIFPEVFDNESFLVL